MASYIYIDVCVCVCIYIYVYIYIYMKLIWHIYITLLNTLSGGKSCLVAPGVAVLP